MKKNFLLLILSLFANTVFSQIVHVDNKAQLDSVIFVAPDYITGTVFLKDGNQIKTLLNYNYHNQNILYIDSETKKVLKLNNLRDVALIEMNKRYFIPILGGLGELIACGDVCLVYLKKVNIETRKVSGYDGMGGSTSAVQAVRGSENTAGNYSGYGDEQTIYDGVISGQVKIILSEKFYLCKLGETKTIPLTKKNLLKMFPSAVDFINSYLDKNNPNLENFEHAKILIKLCNEQLK
ncbi:MAG: hypothetical protein LBG17_04865 [Bacteroidales bacterium]|jgi:hypothetical protein|nr:hypothetical protein [Bacteroidales bacterium]